MSAIAFESTTDKKTKRKEIQEARDYLVSKVISDRKGVHVYVVFAPTYSPMKQDFSKII